MSQDRKKSISLAEDAILNAELEPPSPRVERCSAPDFLPTSGRSEPRLKAMIQKKILPSVLTNRFKYSAIADDEIRLLGIRRGKTDDDMFCVIFKRRLEDVLYKYEALSYCWGAERADCEIHIQDLNVQLPRQHKKKLSFVDAAQLKGPRRFFVRPSLITAMTRLRREEKDVTLWIDAICKDQTPEGKEEKQKQLARMAEIYNSAFNVCIWLGEADIQGHSDSAMQLDRKITDFHTFDMLVASQEAKSQWVDLVDLMKRSWFSRRWVVQEVALARRASVHCGTKVIHWDDFCDAISLLNDKIERLRDNFGNHDVFGDVEGLSASILVTSLHDVCRKSDDGAIQEHLIGLETLVSTLLTFETSNYHDTIFSLISIAKDTPQSFLPGAVSSSLERKTLPFQITVDYRRSVRDLYIEFIRFCVETSGSLDIICRHWAPPVTNPFDETVPMPSWISSLSNSPFGLPQKAQGRQNGENFVKCFGRDARKRYNASRGVEPNNFTFRKNVLGPPSRSRAFSAVGRTKEDTSVLQVIPENSRTNGKGPSQVPEGRPDDRLSVPERLTSSNLGRLITSNIHPATGDLVSPVPTSASSAPSTKEKEEIYNGILKVSGFRLGSILDHSDVIRRGMIPGDWLVAMGWAKDKSQNRVPERLWRTLVADRNPDGGSPPGWYQRACLHCLMDTRITDLYGNLNASSYASRKTAGMTVQFLKRVESVVWNRRFFRGGEKDDVFFGLAPEQAQKGDLVCILFGCTVPVILRELKPTGDVPLYQVMGEAYVHGKMDGEAVADGPSLDPLIEFLELK
ncbi:Heterokaryon incompatibility protein 6 OR allele [Lachnellula suecica]|uniref:Heterokaryon incompatibility protein 6 OR allele n=1 Tax=Lachnellula suecica TaxID=602035 RepID=A0A8T9CA19_9HELO|nr:Heterokaryon incompatibility protein 6 OR allele [Lachnellula suecica]